MTEIRIRPALPEDAAALWRIIAPILREGETYAMPRDASEEEALAWWYAPGNEVFVACAESGDDEVAGTCYLRANQKGGGAHVANCGFMTAPWARGKGIARALALHAIETAKRGGFRAMQFNFVVSHNERAVRLWRSLGFTVAGRIPQGFLRPGGDFSDVLIMYREL